MSHAGHSTRKHAPHHALLRLALFWLIGVAGVHGYILYLELPVPGTPIGTAICIAGCFVLSVLMGLWKRAIPGVVRALTAASCVALPLIVAIVEHVGIDL